MLISLEEIKYHLRLDPEVDDEQDPQLIAMYESALDYCQNYLDRPIPFEGETELNPSVRAAILLVIGDLFANREGTYVGVSIEWATKARPWARFEFLSVRDFMAGQANQSQISARVVIRYREDISHADRIIYKGKIYDIEGILPDNDSGVEYLTIPVSEGVRHV